MEYLKVRNWDKWQTYRSDRGQPPWIKVHRSLQQDWEWVDLKDYQRGQLVAIWLLAASRDGVIPASPEKIQKLCNMSDLPDLQAFVNLGFLEGDVNVASTCQPDGVPDKIQRKLSTEEEEEAEEEKPLSGKPDCVAPILYLNLKIGSNYQPVESNLKFIRARYKEGHTLETILSVVDAKAEEWMHDPTMKKFLRPSTLFNAEKFNQYAGQLTMTDARQSAIDAFVTGDNVIEGEFSHG